MNSRLYFLPFRVGRRLANAVTEPGVVFNIAVAVVLSGPPNLRVDFERV